MNIDTRDIIDYIDSQKKQTMGGTYTEFQDGVVAGLGLVRTFITLFEEREGYDIAEALGTPQHCETCGKPNCDCTSTANVVLSFVTADKMHQEVDDPSDDEFEPDEVVGADDDYHGEDKGYN